MDYSLFTNKGCFGIGIYFSDSSGHLVLAHTECFPSIIPVIAFELVSFESDNQSVVHVVLNDYTYENELGTLVTSFRSFISDHASFNLVFIRRQVNRATHNLARVYVFQSSPSIFYSPPHYIDTVILNEML